MVSQRIQSKASSGLMGLRPPADLAEHSASGRDTAATLQDLPARPSYTVVSSGRDSEEDEPRGKNSDLMTAIGAGAMLVVFLIVVGLFLY